MIKKILEQHPSAAGIGAFELGHAYGRIKEAVQALSTNTILPPSHVWRKLTNAFNTSFRLKSWVEKMHARRRRRGRSATTSTEQAPRQKCTPLRKRKCKAKVKIFRNINQALLQASQNRERRISERRAAVIESLNRGDF